MDSIKKFRQNPMKLMFLMDSIGAVVSTMMLGVVLVQFQNAIGMPLHVLYVLALIAGIFAIYSFVNFLNKAPKPQSLKFIALANFCYCCTTLVLLMLHVDQLTLLGIAYFVGECVVILVLSMVEWKVSNSETNGMQV